MSEERVEVVRRIYEASAAGDAATVLSLYDPEIEYDFSASPFREVISHDVYRGIDGLREFIAERFEDFQEAADRCDELIDAGEFVISVVTSRGRGRVSGVEVERLHYGVWSFRAGKARLVRWYDTLADALAAAGLEQ